MSKTDLEELGENTEDLAEGFSKYAKEIKALSGFDIMIDDTHFKDLYDIMEGISGVWDKLSDTQQARVAEILGGTRQLQVISSIIGNWKDAAGAYETAINSAGASSKANAIYMESVTAHLDQMKAAFEELSTNVMNSGFTKFIIDTGKTILEILNNITKLTGSLGTILIGGAIYKGVKSIASAYTTIKGANTELGGMGRMVKALKTAFPNLSSTIISTKNAFVEATTKGEKFKSVLAGIKSGIEGMSTGGKIALFAIAIGIFTKVMQYIMDASNRAEEEATKTAEKSKQAVSELEQQQKSLKDLVSQYKTLAAQSKTDLSVRAELKSVQEQINKLVGGEIDGLDLVNGKLDEQLAKIREKARINASENNTEYSKATQNTIKAAENTTMYDGRGFDMEKTLRLRVVDVYDKNGNNDAMGVSNAFKKALEDADINVTYTLEADNTSTNDFALPDDVLKRYEAIKKIVQWLKENGYTAGEVWDKFTDAEIRLKKAIDGVVDSASKEVNNVLLGSDNMSSNVKTVEDYVNMRDKLIEEVKQSPGVADALDKGFVDEEWINNTVDNYLGSLEQYADVYNQWWNKFGSDAAKGIEKLKEQYKDADFSKWVDTLTPEDTEIVLELQLDTKSAKYSLEDWKKALADAKKEGSNDTLANSFAGIMQSKDSDGKTFSEKAQAAKSDILALKEAFDALQTRDFGDGGYNEWLNDLIQKFPLLAGQTEDLGSAIKALIEQMQSNVVSDFDEKVSQLSSTTLNSADKAAIAQWREQWEQLGETAVKFSSRLEETVSAFDTIKSAIDDYNESGVVSLDNMRSILALDDKYINALLNERGEIDLSTESYRRLVEAEALELKAQLLQESLNTVNSITDRAGALEYLESSQQNAAQASLNLADAQWQEAYAAAAVKDATQGTGDLYKQTVIAARRAYDVRVSLIDSYVQGATAVDNFKESVESEKKALEDSKSALEDQKKALEETKNGYEDALSAVKDLIDWVQDYIKQIKNDEIDALQEKKDAIDELIDAQKELIDAEKEEYEWNKKISEKQNTVAKDALAASIASLDDSSAGRKAQKQANDKLAESRSDMLDTLYDHEIEIRKDALDKLKEEQDEYYDNLINNIQDYLNNEVQLYKDACTMIDNDSGDLYGKLLWYCQNYTTTTEAEFNHMWNSAQSALQQYNTANLGTFELLNNLQGRIYEVDSAIDAVAQGISSYEKAIEGVQSKLENLSSQAQRTIADVKAATDMENNLKGNWYYMWQGYPYFSNKENREEAIADILSKISSMYGGRFPASAATIYGEIKRFANGTNSAPGGLSLVGERGAELHVLNQGDGILNHRITQGLAALGTNPAQFIADAGQMLIKNLFGNGANPSFGAISNNNQIAPNININIQGDATQATVNALKAAVSDIASKVKKDIMGTPLKYKRLI